MMFRMTALIRMRLAAFLRTGRVIAPLLAVLAVILIAYGGGQASSREAYGFSAVLIFPVLAWQTQLLLNAEPDTQRRLALVALGSRTRELAAGLVAALLLALPAIGLELVVPWLVGGVTAGGDPAGALGFGGWALAIAVPPAVLLGALASRVVTGSPGRGIAVLTGGSVLAIVLGIRTSPAPWLAPPLLSTARAMASGIDAAAVARLSVWSAAWTALALLGYWALRRTRS
jgi:hypothetical protein